MKTFFQISLICCSVVVIKLQAQEWVKVNPVFDPPGNYNTYYGVFVDERTGWWLAGPTASVLHTTNGGLTWKKQVDNIALESIEFKDALHGWMAGRILPDYVYNILITKDGGKTWKRYLTPSISCLAFSDSLNGFAGGGNIYKTTDGGVTWVAQMIEPHRGSIRVADIFFIDKKYGWAVGDGAEFDAGMILSTADSGKTWQFNDSSTTVGYSVFFTDTLDGYIAGLGMIKVTHDGGKSWTTNYFPGPWLRDIVFTDDSNGWAVGDYGFIWHTADRGINWSQVESGTTSHLYRIFFFDNGKKGYILGADSTLLKYSKTVGVKEQQPFLATSFKLYQNYPNPFNSGTQIKFEITMPGLVSLTIYNLLGKEVATLLNEEKEQGFYSVHWDGKDHDGKELSSAIYFYRLTMGTANEVRKLLFLK